MKQLNVDDKTATREAYYVYELWRAVKRGSLPETVHVRFFPSEDCPNGRDVVITLDDAHAHMREEQ